MSIRKRRKIRFRARLKRSNRRARLKAAGKNPDKIYYSGIYLGEGEK